jgi:hypothetical protein
MTPPSGLPVMVRTPFSLAFLAANSAGRSVEQAARMFNAWIGRRGLL